MDITLYANAKTLDNDAIIRTFTFYHGKKAYYHFYKNSPIVSPGLINIGHLLHCFH